MKYLPIFLNIENQKILIIGGGNAALKKINTLIDFNASIHVVAPEVEKKIEEYEKNGLLTLNKREFQIEDICEADIVVVAADEENSQRASQLCKKQGKLFADVSKGEKGDFIFPAHKKEGELTVAVSTNGRFPLLAKGICSQIDLSIGKWLPYLEEKRKFIIENVSDRQQKIYLLGILAKFETVQTERGRSDFEQMLEEYKHERND